VSLNVGVAAEKGNRQGVTARGGGSWEGKQTGCHCMLGVAAGKGNRQGVTARGGGS